jgi:plastocyanin
MHQRRQAAVILVIGSLAGAACSKDSGGTPPGPTPTQMAKVSGDSQVAAAGASLTAYAVIVKDASNNPVANVNVTWSAGAGGGSITSPTVTDAGGMATAIRTLGPGAGTQTATASVGGLSGSPVIFTAFSQIQGATSIQGNGGSAQSDTVLSTLGVPISVQVLDHAGAAVSGVIVNWSATGGGNVSQLVDTTDGSGISSVVRTLGGTAGTAGTTASVTGLVGSPVTISATATAGNAAQIALSAGDGQTGSVGNPLPTPHTVLVTDSHGNPKSGVSVTWVVGDGAGSVSTTTPATNINGVAAVTRTLGPGAGTQTDTAKAALTGSPVVFTADAVVLPTSASVTVGPGIIFSPDSVRVAQNATVTWTWAPASTTHNVQWLTAPAGAKPTDSAIQNSGTYQWTFPTAGVYTYDCVIHGSSMSGKVVVQ